MSEDTDAAAELLVSAGRGDELIRAYDRAGRNVRSTDFSGYGPLIVALRETGRPGEANSLLNEFARGAREISRRGQTPFSSLLQAQIAGLRGECDGGIRILERQFREMNLEFLFDYLGEPFDQVAYRCMQRNPRFEALRAEKNRVVQRERREAIVALKHIGLFAEASQIERASRLN